MEHKHVVVIGDIHGRYKEMIELLKKFNIEVNEETKNIEYNSIGDRLLVFCGDYIDKCPYENTKWMIEFIHRNIGKDNVIFLRGNHERFVYNYLNKEKSYLQTPTEMVNNYFDSINHLQNDEEYKKIFFNIYDDLIKFVKLPNCIVSHAPIGKELVCKIHSDRMIAGEIKYGMSMEDQIKILNEYFLEMSYSEPLLVSGHKPTTYAFAYSNRVFIDTGADRNNVLSGCMISKDKNVRFKNVEINGDLLEDIPNYHVLIKQQNYTQRMVSFDDLDNEDLRRLRYLKKNDIRFISGTMPPAWATKDNIEDIDTVFDYYRKNGIDEVIIEPKYMGSRINVYMNCENIEESKFITRNGYIARINDESKKVLIDQLVGWREKLYSKFGENIKTVVIDGELLPWSLLGENLITNTFNIYRDLIEYELSELESADFDKNIQEKFQFIANFAPLNKKDIIDQFGHHNFRLYKLLSEYNHIDINTKKDSLNIFESQLNLYTNDKIKTEIKPFMVLKVNDKLFYELSNLNTHHEHFKLLNDDDIMLVNVNNKEDINSAKKFFNELTYEKGFEGVVVKPNDLKYSTFNNIVPYFKVRNENYLTIIYGYLYKEFYDKFVKSKNRTLGRKIQASIQEWNSGIKMLKSVDDKEFVNAYLEFKYGEKLELETDPRL